MKTNQKILAQRLLAAARKGQVELQPEEQFLTEEKEVKGSTIRVNNKLASKGFSLIEQARSAKSVDLFKKNVKYIKYTDGRPLDPKKADTMLAYHMKRLPDKAVVRKHREQITGLREPKIIKKKKNKSVFSEKDFKNMKRTGTKKVQDSDGQFV